jgi:GTP-binding protein
MSAPLVVIVGKPNVGKSTLFNSLTGGAGAITSNEPGTTRDWLEGTADLDGTAIKLVDTCGWGLKTELGALMDESLPSAIEKADLALFAVSAREPLEDDEMRLAAFLRKRNLRMLLVCNKCDKPEDDAASWEFARLGLGAAQPISALRRRNMNELKGRMTQIISTPSEPIKEDRAGLACIMLGQPNVGKSSIFNALLGYRRSLVHDEPGTTRDPVKARMVSGNEKWEIVDTAGVVRRWKYVHGALGRDAASRGLRHLDGADVVTLVLDATVPLGRQDLRLAQEAVGGGAGIAVALNKCDLLPPADVDLLRVEAPPFLSKRFPDVGRFPMLFCSAHTGDAMEDLKATVTELARLRRIKISPGDLSDLAYKWPTSGRPWRVRQIGAAPLVFAVDAPSGVHLGPRFAVNRIRETFGLHGVPLLVKLWRDGEEFR